MPGPIECGDGNTSKVLRAGKGASFLSIKGSGGATGDRGVVPVISVKLTLICIFNINFPNFKHPNETG